MNWLRSHLLTFVLLAFPCMVGCASSEDPHPGGNEEDVAPKPAWAMLDPLTFAVDPPPAPGSAEDQADFTALHQDEASRSPSDCALAGKQRFPSFNAFFGASGSPLSAAERLQVARVGDQVVQATVNVTAHFKKKYMRPRPYDEDLTLTPCVPKPGGNMAYPSAHAASAAATACVLAQKFPQKAQQILDYGKYLGDLRALVGVHHPSDVVAGQKLGNDVCAALLADPRFVAAW